MQQPKVLQNKTEEFQKLKQEIVFWAKKKKKYETSSHNYQKIQRYWESEESDWEGLAWTHESPLQMYGYVLGVLKARNLSFDECRCAFSKITLAIKFKHLKWQTR